VDSGVSEGAEVPIHYDPLMAKLIVWGRGRAEAVDRMARALAEFGVAGVRTTIPFHAAVMRHPDFVAGRLSTAFVARAFPGGLPAGPPETARAAVVAAALAAVRRAETVPSAPMPAADPSPWALAARPGAPPRRPD
jgi:acetyl/propionyl-CoA carboxylase alpha subunit